MPADRIVIGMSVWKTIAISLICIVLGSSILFLALIEIFTKSNDPTWAKIFAIIFGLMVFWPLACRAILILNSLIKRDLLIAINDEGFSALAGFDSRQPERWRWKDVNGIERVTNLFNSGVLVQLNQEAHASRKRTQWHSIDPVFLEQKIEIKLTLADMSSKKIEVLMRQYWQAATSNA